MPHHQLSHRLQVVADADPTVLARVCALMTTLSLIPASLDARLDVNADRISLEIGLGDACPRQVDLLQRKLGQLVPVDSVLVKSV